MLRLLFNRESRFVAVLEWLGVAGLIYLLFFGWFASQSTAVRICFAAYLLMYLINRFFSVYPWYGKGFSRDAGICLHFRKMYVAGAYFIFLTNLALILGVGWPALLAGTALFVLDLHISAILLYFHFRDKDERPPNFLARR